MTSVSQTTQQTMVGWLLKNDLRRMWAEAIVPAFARGHWAKPWKSRRRACVLTEIRTGNLSNERQMRYRIIRLARWHDRITRNISTLWAQWKICLVLKHVLALCFKRIIVPAIPIVNCFNEDLFTVQVEVYFTRLDISVTCTRPWNTRKYTFCTSPIVLMDRSQMTQIRTWGGRRLMDQPSVRRDMMWTKNMPFLLLNEMWR
jgi:hypothetical protein